jgi:hypothetical protein
VEKTMTVHPGVTFLINTSAGLTVRGIGCLKLLGTAEKPIKFKGHVNSTEKGSWENILIKTGNQNIMQYVELENGGSETNYGVVWVDTDAKLSMTNCKITGSKGYGIYINTTATLTAFANNVITGCDRAPARLMNLSQTGVLDLTSTLTGNGDNYISIAAGLLTNANLTTQATTVPYYLEGPERIEKTWTIEEGVTFYMHSTANIVTRNLGSIEAIGTATKPIIFTRLPGLDYNWKEISMGPTSANSTFTHCIFEYGGSSGYKGVLYLDRGTRTTLNNVAFNHSATYGVYIYDDAAVTHSGVTFSDNATANVRLSNDNTSATLPN